MTAINNTEQAGLTYVGPSAFEAAFSSEAPFWLRPVGITPLAELAGVQKRADSLALAGGPLGFTHLDMVAPHNGGYCAARVTVAEALKIGGQAAEAQVHALSSPRPAFAGLPMDRPHIMGIVNVTPDSFSDGGRFLGADAAIAYGRAMGCAGASLLDIGGESTRPGAEPVTREDELARITPVISALSADGHLVSADTRHADVMGPALSAGARIINDVSGFTDDGAAEVMGEAHSASPRNSFAIAMHMQGTPQTMQDNPAYGFAAVEVFEVLRGHIDRLVAAGLPRSHIAVDPGFGFGKTPVHNAQVIKWTALFHGLGVPVLIGVSRKSSIPKLAAAGGAGDGAGYGDEAYGASSDERLGGGLALTLAATQQGAQLIRTHDVAETVQAVAVQRGMGFEVNLK